MRIRPTALIMLPLIVFGADHFRLKALAENRAASPSGELTAEIPERVIRKVLEDQARAWNEGDVDAYMNGYWKSDETVFTSGGKIMRGWQTVFDRYRKSYPDRASMGELSFTDLEIKLLNSRAAFVLGRWRLKRENDSPHGVFTLVLQKFGKDWRIIHDHTSGSD